MFDEYVAWFYVDECGWGFFGLFEVIGSRVMVKWNISIVSPTYFYHYILLFFIRLQLGLFFMTMRIEVQLLNFSEGSSYIILYTY